MGLEVSVKKMNICYVIFIVRSTMANQTTVERNEIKGIEKRLEEEKIYRLLIQSNIEVLTLKLRDMERRLSVIPEVNHIMRWRIYIYAICQEESERQDLRLRSLLGVTGEQTMKDIVGFSVELTTRRPTVSYEKIGFDNTLENYGRAYNYSNAEFRAPVKGLYLFSVTIHSLAGTNTHVEIVKDGQHLGYIYGGDSKSDWGDAGSNTIVTTLEKNQAVYVRGRPGHSGYIEGGGLSTFTGILVSSLVNKEGCS